MSKKPEDYLKLDPIVPIKLKDQEYKLEINNLAVKGIYKDTGHNLLSMGFQKEAMQDPSIMGAMLYWALKTHHPEVTQDQVDRMLTYKQSPYILHKLGDCLDFFLPDEDEPKSTLGESGLPQ